MNAVGTADWRVTYIMISGTNDHPPRHRIDIDHAPTGYPRFRVTLGQHRSHDAYYIDEITYTEIEYGRDWHCRVERPWDDSDSAAEVKRKVEHVLGGDRGPNCEVL